MYFRHVANCYANRLKYFYLAEHTPLLDKKIEFKYSIYKYTNTQIHKYTNTHIQYQYLVLLS